MARTKPNRNPPQIEANQAGAPNMMPPVAEAITSEVRPRELSAAELMLTARGADADAMPTLEPPQEQAASGVGAWNSDKRVNAVWSLNAQRNAWAAITGVGWRRLGNASDSGLMALNLLMCHARQSQTSVSYREEADGMIHECYVW